jgi:photosystem II stability/assembly factor-like uncharacterized protein
MGKLQFRPFEAGLLGCATALVLACGATPNERSNSGGSSGGSVSQAGSTGTSGGSAGTTAGGSSSTGGSVSPGTGGNGAAPSSGGSETSGGSGNNVPGERQTCTTTINSTLPENAPDLEVGVWKDITQPEIPKGDAEDMIAQGMAMDPCNSSVLYWGNTPFNSGNHGGLYKSTDAGSSWNRVGHIDEPLHVRIDPRDPQHLYSGNGVRGATLGFWESFDGGETWEKPAGWTAKAAEVGFIDDLYDVAVDPTDFDHVLVSSHSAWGWTDSEWNTNAGILESTDGGDTWITRAPAGPWGAGHSVDFLYNPEQGIGDPNTWLVGTQGNGYWRTSDAGETWEQVTQSTIFHGGGDTFYSQTGVLYATSSDGLLRSTDNGVTFVDVNSGGGNTGVWGDGNLIYTAPAYAQGTQPFVTSPDDDGMTWTPQSQAFPDSGPFEMVFDPVNKILYSTMWFQGIWALKVE